MTALTTLTLDTFGSVLPRPDTRLAWLHEHFGRYLARLIKHVTRGQLQPEDLQDAYQEAMQAFWTLLGHKELPPTQYLAVLQVIARRKGLDALRRRGIAPATNVEAVLSSVVGERHVSLLAMGQTEWHELRTALVGVVAELPERQRLVAEVYFAHYEEFGPRDTHQPLTALVSAVTGKAERVETVKSLWHAARKAIIAALQRLGYTLHEGTDP